MAALFDDAKTQYFEVAQRPVGLPVTPAGKVSMACWFYDDAANRAAALMFLGDVGSGSQYLSLEINAAGSNRILARTRSGLISDALTTATYNINTWNHAVAVFDNDADDRKIYLNGGNLVTNSDAQGFPDDWNITSIGRLGDSSPDDEFSGAIAEYAMWNVALTAANVAELFTGASPRLVAPGGRVLHTEMIRPDASNNVHDRIGGLTLVGAGGTGTPVAFPHPRIIRPSGPQVPAFLSAAVAAGAPDRQLRGVGA